MSYFDIVFLFYSDKKGIVLSGPRERALFSSSGTLSSVSFNFKEFYGLHAKEEIMNIRFSRSKKKPCARV